MQLITKILIAYLLSRLFYFLLGVDLADGSISYALGIIIFIFTFYFSDKFIDYLKNNYEKNNS